MALPAIIGAVSLGAGLLGSLSGGKAAKKAYKAQIAALNEAQRMVEQQYGQIDDYFNQANQAFEQQYSGYYGQQIGEAVNRIANQGIYESPVSENVLNRTRTALGETYATAKSQLAGQRLQARAAVDSQKINYLQNLANAQYQRQMSQQQAKMQTFGMLGGLGTSLLGI